MDLGKNKILQSRFKEANQILFTFRHNVLPIVMGAELEEYQRVAPQNSFIHVNQFKGPKELAEYLHVLDQDDKQYNEYFKVCFPLFSFVIY